MSGMCCENSAHSQFYSPRRLGKLEKSVAAQTKFLGAEAVSQSPPGPQRGLLACGTEPPRSRPGICCGSKNPEFLKSPEESKRSSRPHPFIISIHSRIFPPIHDAPAMCQALRTKWGRLSHPWGPVGRPLCKRQEGNAHHLPTQ